MSDIGGKMPEKTLDTVVSQIIGVQSRLYAYILTLLGDPEDAADVLQETSLVLWHKAHEYREGTDFIAWAYSVAKFQVLAHCKRRKRDRLHFFGDDLASLLADETPARLTDFSARQAALERCLDRLPPHQRQLLERRYVADVSVQQIAADRRAKPNTIAQAIHRIRQTLLDCISRTVSRETRT